MLFVYFLVVASFASAELSISKSYLPPPPTSGTTGYTRGAAVAQDYQEVQVVGDRNLEQGRRDNGSDRNSSNDQLVSFSSHSHGRGDNAAARNSVEENSEAINYNIGYMVSDFGRGVLSARVEDLREVPGPVPGAVIGRKEAED